MMSVLPRRPAARGTVDLSPPTSAMTRHLPYATGLDRNVANHTPLTPLSLIARTAYTYPDALAVVHGDAPVYVGARPMRAPAASLRRWPAPASVSATPSR